MKQAGKVLPAPRRPQRCGTLASSHWPQALSRTRDALAVQWTQWCRLQMAFNAVATNRFSIEAVTADSLRGAPSRAMSACIVSARLFAERLTAASHRRGFGAALSLLPSVAGGNSAH